MADTLVIERTSELAREHARVPSSPAAPFPITIGPEQAIPHRGWCEARDRILAALRADPSLVLLLGEPGTGKTLLLQDIARLLRADGADVRLQPRGDLPLDSASTAVPGQRRIVLIDEADRLNATALARLGQLGARAFVLAGLDGPEGLGSREIIPGATIVRLSPLPPGEVAAFLAQRLHQAGLPDTLLSGGAMGQLAARSGGVPRVLNILAGAALFLARAEQSPRVEAVHVDEAATRRAMDSAEIAPAPEAAKPASAALPAASSPAAPRAPARSPARHRPAYRIPALVTVAGIAAAFAWAVAWPGPQARQAPPLPIVRMLTSRPRLIALALTAAQPAVPTAPASHQKPAPEQPLALAGLLAPSPSALPAEAFPSALRASAFAEASAVPVPLPARSPPIETATHAPTSAPLPPAAPIYVALRYLPGSELAATRLAASLRIRGIAVDGPSPASARTARPGARYFFAEDRATADAVLKAAGLPGASAMAETAGRNQPRPGLVELTISRVQADGPPRVEPPARGQT